MNPDPHEDLLDEMPAWASFPAEIDGKAALLSVDLTWAEGAGDPDRPTLVVIEVPFLSTDDRGAPGPDDLAALEALEDAFEMETPDADTSVLVGHALGENSVRWYLYAPDGAAVQDLVRRATAAAPRHEPSARAQEDADWAFYSDTLLPDDYQFRLARDGWLIDSLVEAGDAGQESRPIRHCASFRKARDRDRFRGWCQKEGFTVDQELPPSRDEPVYSLMFHHVGPVTLEEAWDMTTKLTEGAASCSGEYDGWECEPVAASEP